MTNPFTDWMSQRWFSLVHGNSLIYNACWEDPRADREALRLTADDRIAVITSAGCNALDYVLDSPARVIAIDVNPRQNALLELKIAAIRALDFETFFALFGEGKVENFSDLYRERLRPQLSPTAARHWDRNQGVFSGKGFYFSGAVGTIARWINHYIDYTGIRGALYESFESRSMARQQSLYWNMLKTYFWNDRLRSVLSWDPIFAFIGVPSEQKSEVEKAHPGGVSGFIEAAIDRVFSELPLWDNYFWWLYLNGAYTTDRCPEYLKRENFGKLKQLVDKIEIHTSTLVDFLNAQREEISCFVLLDHMDWLRARQRDVLTDEWSAMLRIAAPGARFLWRSASPQGEFVSQITARPRGRDVKLGEVLHYNRSLAARLSRTDRVQTYASFSVATLAAGWSC